MPTGSACEGNPTGISPLQLAGVGIGDDCGSEKIAEGTMGPSSSSLLGKVPPLRMYGGIRLAVVEISLMSDSAHGAAVSCTWLLFGGRDNVAARVGHRDASKSRSGSGTEKSGGTRPAKESTIVRWRSGWGEGDGAAMET